MRTTEGAQRCGDDEDVGVPCWYDHSGLEVGRPNRRMVQRKEISGDIIHMHKSPGKW